MIHITKIFKKMLFSIFDHITIWLQIVVFCFTLKISIFHLNSITTVIETQAALLDVHQPLHLPQRLLICHDRLAESFSKLRPHYSRAQRHILRLAPEVHAKQNLVWVITYDAYLLKSENSAWVNGSPFGAKGAAWGLLVPPLKSKWLKYTVRVMIKWLNHQ